MSFVFLQFTPQDHENVKNEVSGFRQISNERYVDKLPMNVGRTTGIYGEQAFMRVRPKAVLHGRDEIGFDFISGGKKIEVKSYGIRKGQGPHKFVWVDKVEYDKCTADYFVWVAVQKDYESAFVLGFKDRLAFLAESEFRLKEQLSPITGKPTKADHYLMPIDLVQTFKQQRG